MNLPFTHPGDMDALELFEMERHARVEEAQLEAAFNEAARRTFRTTKGREFLRLAMQRYNFNGSVFSAGNMDPLLAAHRDGMRAVLSDILNAAARAKPSNQ